MTDGHDNRMASSPARHLDTLPRTEYFTVNPSTVILPQPQYWDTRNVPHQRITTTTPTSSPRGKAQELQKRDTQRYIPPNGSKPYICNLCGHSANARSSIERHFTGSKKTPRSSCQATHGTPANAKWDDHPSCLTAKRALLENLGRPYYPNHFEWGKNGEKVMQWPRGTDWPRSEADMLRENDEYWQKKDANPWYMSNTPFVGMEVSQAPWAAVPRFGSTTFMPGPPEPLHPHMQHSNSPPLPPPLRKTEMLPPSPRTSAPLTQVTQITPVMLEQGKQDSVAVPSRVAAALPTAFPRFGSKTAPPWPQLHRWMDRLSSSPPMSPMLAQCKQDEVPEVGSDAECLGEDPEIQLHSLLQVVDFQSCLQLLHAASTQHGREDGYQDDVLLAFSLHMSDDQCAAMLNIDLSIFNSWLSQAIDHFGEVHVCTKESSTEAQRQSLHDLIFKYRRRHCSKDNTWQELACCGGGRAWSMMERAGKAHKLLEVAE